MDGTLLDSQHRLSNEFFEIFPRLQAKGIAFAPASGRQYYNIRNVFHTLRDQLYFIAENGGYMAYRDEDWLVQEMDPALTRKLISDTRDVEGTFTILCGKDRAYIQDNSPFFIEHLQKFYDEYRVVPDLLNVADDRFLKIAVCDMSGAEGNVYKLFRHLSSELQIKVSGNIWMDISHKDANKGTALRNLQQRLGVSPEETMVFGDYLNDIEMMEQAHFSFAMENAHPDVKAISRFTARSNDDNGVIEILRRVLEA